MVEIRHTSLTIKTVRLLVLFSNPNFGVRRENFLLRFAGIECFLQLGGHLALPQFATGLKIIGKESTKNAQPEAKAICGEVERLDEETK